MQRIAVVTLCSILGVGIGLVASAPKLTPAGFDAKVLDVHDGDTITVQVRIRLRGIDAPELKQEYGNEARQALAARTETKKVRVVPRDVDRYGRLVADVYADGNERDINTGMVREGSAWWYRGYAKDDTDLKNSEAQAREAKRGLWSGNPIPPWEWRRKH